MTHHLCPQGQVSDGYRWTIPECLTDIVIAMTIIQVHKARFLTGVGILSLSVSHYHYHARMLVQKERKRREEKMKKKTERREDERQNEKQKIMMCTDGETGVHRRKLNWLSQNIPGINLSKNGRKPS